MTTLRAACIDIGSNTTRLLVADVDDGRLEVVTQETAFTALGRELQAHGRIGAAKLVELIAVVEAQVATAAAARRDPDPRGRDRRGQARRQRPAAGA